MLKQLYELVKELLGISRTHPMLATKQDLKELEYRLVIRLGTIMVIGIGIVATLVKIL